MHECKKQRREVEKLAVVDAHISPVDFFQQFILPRNPVKFSSLINDKLWNGTNWSNQLLREKSGDAVLRVESRSSSSESFGCGNEEMITFSEFLDSLDSDTETAFYLTTQELFYTHEGQPSLTSPPVDGLIGDFPWVPKLCGNLIPQNINLWFGSSKLPTSSGLHHDFHDNLYILLRGEKQITLFSPEEAHNMYTEGEIVRIYPNGRINYKNQLTNADGSDEASLIALKASSDLDLAADLLATAEEGGDLEEAEKRIEDALEALLDAEIEGNQEEDDSEDEDQDGTGYEALNLLRSIVSKKENDDDDNNDDNDNDFVNEDYMDSDEEKREAERRDKASSNDFSIYKQVESVTKPKNSPSIKIRAPVMNDKKDREMEISVTDAPAHSLAGLSTSIKRPPNFSKVVTSLPLKQLAIEYPLYYEALTSSKNKSKGGRIIEVDDRTKINYGQDSLKTDDLEPRCVEVTIRAGEMLYIPTGWFHEVRSTGGGCGGHLAFNYWFHPPDGQTFEKPYSSDFWPDDWKKRNLK